MLRSVFMGLLLLTSCGSDDDSGTQSAGGSSNPSNADKPYCTYSNCSGEPVVYPDKAACDDLYASPCIEEWKTWNECVLSTEQCGDDGRVVAESVQACKGVFDSLNECLAKLSP